MLMNFVYFKFFLFVIFLFELVISINFAPKKV